MKRMSINRWVFLLVAALGALISGSVNAAVAINDTYSFSTADEYPLNVHVVDNDDVGSGSVTLSAVSYTHLTLPTKL
ncbi:MAG: hypothetical protein KUG73_01210, partial [Pseudomonadales bacterium]|nr:hypothetical protein [Pseudomonadales bacterium]